MAAFADDGTTRGRSGSSSRTRRRRNGKSGRSRQSLASALTSRDCSPQNGRGNRPNGDGGASETQHQQPEQASSQSALWRVVNQGQGGEGGGASDEVEGGQQQSAQASGARRGEEEEEAAASKNVDVDNIMSISSNSSNVEEEPHAQLGSEANEVEVARADFTELFRDAQEEREGSTRTGPEGGIMEALLETSEGVVAAVETQQKVGDAS